MRTRFGLSATFAVAALSIAFATNAIGQTPPPKKEAELVAAGYKKLTGPELAALIIGNTMYLMFLAPYGGAPAGTQSTSFYPDAKKRITIPTGGPYSGKKVEGNWWIEGNSLCIEQRILAPGHQCSVWYQAAPSSSIYACNQPVDCNFMVRVVPGNANNM